MVPTSLSKMAFSEAYVQAVSSAAGYVFEPDRFDFESIDGTVKGDRALARFDVQLKCTTVATVVRNDHVAFRLRREHYDDLRTTETSRPLILIVVIAPQAMSDWVHQSEQEMVVQHCGYWTWLQGAPPSENSTWQTVRIPRANQFTVAALREIMARVLRGEDIVEAAA
jgi:hypothetical protein